MKIYIVRHAIAEEQSASGGDEARALTEEGKEKMKQAVRGFYKLSPEIQTIFSSPLVRAKQTADIVGKPANLKTEIMEELSPIHEPEDVCKALKQKKVSGDVALVGHEPNCSRLMSYLLANDGSLISDFKKGAIAVIESADLTKGSACLLMFLSPKVLRAMAGE